MNAFRSRLLPLSLAAMLGAPLLFADVLPPAADAWVTAKFQQLDKKGDGKLTADELPHPEWIRLLDLNGDGVATLEEVKTFFSKAPALLQKMSGINPTAAAGPSAADPAKAPPREAPKRLNPFEYGIGSLIPDLKLHSLDGKEASLSELQKQRPLVIALFSPTCPVSKRYLPTLAVLEQQYRAQGVGMLIVCTDGADTPAAIKSALDSARLAAPCFQDPDKSLCRALGATSSTDCFLLDAARTLVYRGAIDDQYGLSYSQEIPHHRYLTDALDAALAQTTPSVSATEAPGCALDLGAPATTATTIASPATTYHNRISRVLASHCVECHRSGGIAPFPLETYDQVMAKTGMIRKMVSRGLMPPWFAAAPAPGHHSPWLNDRSLSERERADLLGWLDAGKPAGDPKEAPLAPHWPEEWQIGQPDAIVQIPQPIEVQATGVMPYQFVTVDPNLAEDKWVRGFEVRPTARDVVHHVLVFVKSPGDSKGGRRTEGGAFLAAYVPGNSSVVYPEGFAKSLPAGSKLIFQIHYTPNGTATHDQVRLGLLFSKERPEHIVRVAEAVNHKLSIPPGADNHEETAVVPVPFPVMVLGFMPHMHLRGKSFRFETILPDGKTDTALEVPRYDFNWQLAYRYADPIYLPAGARIRATGWFDNSANNPANPDPKATVHWGQQTTDEMMLGYVEYCLVGEGSGPRLGAR